MMPIVYEHSTMSLLDVFLGIVFLSLKLDTHNILFFKFNKKFKARQWKFLNIKPWLMIPKTQFLNLVDKWQI